ncbi:Uncharacterised protein [Flavobacterium hibernum]|nr:Uncharacterised protein [Flavobacterium hibernum]
MFLCVRYFFELLPNVLVYTLFIQSLTLKISSLQ